MPGLEYFIDGHQRLFWLYLAASALMGGLFALRYPRIGKILWSKALWWHPSARLDYLYFFVSAVIKSVVIIPILIGAGDVALWTLRTLQHGFGFRVPLGWEREAVVVLYTVTLFTVSDLSRYLLHRWMHTVPFLWRFHRVHHSAQTLTPVTFYRIHPVENLLFGLRYSLSVGVVTGVFVYFFGARLGMVEVLGVNILLFAFGLLGANLRHSPVPLRFGRAERWIVSPYMHQLHHSEEGARRNYGGVLAVWDRLFGTLWLPKTRRLRFGFKSNPHTSIWAVLFEPFNFKNAKAE